MAPEPNVIIRPARPDDAAGLLAIYEPVVNNTTISFEESPPPLKEFQRRMQHALEHYAWLVACVGDRPAGYAYATRFRERSAYRFSTETTIYMAQDFHGRGIGRLLYLDLFRALSERNLHSAFAGITLPNEASVAFHRSLGFSHVGTLREVGFKFGRWHDVSWWQRPVNTGDSSIEQPAA
jgi:phosphinothricin acetyltransferase